MKRISVGNLDPNFVVEFDGQLYRKVCADREGRWDGFDTFIFGQLFRDLMAQKLVVEHAVDNALTIDGEIYVPVVRISHFSPPLLWTHLQQAEALKLVAKINLFLEGSGWLAADCHLGNVTYFKTNPIYTDAGSFCKDNVKMAFAHFANEAKKIGLDLPFSWKESLAALEKFVPKYRATEWDDYDRSTLPVSVDSIKPVTAEQKLILGWIRDSKDVLDMGANRGVFSRLIAATGKPVVAIDISPACVDANWKAARALKLPITALCGSFNTLIKNALWHRHALACDTVLASSLTHHLFRSGLNWWEMENVFRAFTKNELLVEYVSKDDPCLGTWTLPLSYTQCVFESAFSEWTILETSNPERASRTWYRMLKSR